MEFKDAGSFHIDLLRLSKKHGEVFSAYIGKKSVHRTLIRNSRATIEMVNALGIIYDRG